MSFAPVFEIISDIMFTLYLIRAAYQDHRERLVLRGTHLIGLAAVGLYFVPAVVRLAVVMYENMDGYSGGALFAVAQAAPDLWHDGAVRMAALMLCLLCEGMYRRFSLYGLADSLVFLNCALYYGVRTDAFSVFFLFWWLKAFSGLLLLAVQLARRRGLKWKLDEPAAYIPYILCAFTLTNTVLKR